MKLHALTHEPMVWLEDTLQWSGALDAEDLIFAQGEHKGGFPEDWRSRLTNDGGWHFIWGDFSSGISSAPSTGNRDPTLRVFTVERANIDIPPDLLARLVTTLPFTRLVLDGPYDGWRFSDTRPGFLYKLPRAGWALALKGKQGHAHLSSRKWLDESPCKIHRLPNDVTVVQFCELGVDPKVAWEQAVPGWQFFRLANPCTTQFDRPFNMTHAPGDYLPDRRTLRIPVYGTPVVDDEFLMDLVALRARKLLGESRPLDRIEFVFADPAEAREHLHRIWLMDMAVLTYVDGVETDLTADYDPPTPDKPEWTKRVPDLTVEG